MWISRIFSTGSRVYVRRKPLNKPWFWMGSKLNKKSAVAPGASSAHLILWIFSSLSTKRAGKSWFCAGNDGFSGLTGSLVDVVSVSNRACVSEVGLFFSEAGHQNGRRRQRCRRRGVIEVEQFCSAGLQPSRRVVRFTTKSLYTE